MSTLYFRLTLLILGLLVGCDRPRKEQARPEPDTIRSVSIDPSPVIPTPNPAPESLPPAVHQDSDGSVHLSPLTAKLVGEGLELNDWDQIAGFKNRAQRVVWQMQLSAPGTYQVEVDAICTGPTQEARMRVSIGETRFSEADILLSDNDQALVTTSLGEITLDAAKGYRIEVEMVGLPLLGKFAVSEIRLVPKNDSLSPLSKFKRDDGSTEAN
ncbi:hypothetical protein AB1K70_13070 [Bremerella sp. JC770]|uniref:hypothetical protein n=1 Tax=Bremerella sp. JC770 TaxID=3232137 RepID=UPI0034582CE4